MKNAPKYKAGDLVEYKAGKTGAHYGFDMGVRRKVKKVIPPLPGMSGQWGGWVVKFTNSNMAFPAGWFSRIES